MAKKLGKIVKVSEPYKIKLNTVKQVDIWHDSQAPLAQQAGIPLLCCPPPESVTIHGKLINQAIYWIANDEPKKARRCLLAIPNPQSSYSVKCWVKEEQAVQKRHPEERARYHGKPMPAEFQIEGN